MSDIKDYTFVVEPEQRVIEVAIGGPQGASLVWAGEWNPETLYKGQYVVFYGGIAYVSLQNANLGNTPNPEGDAYWEPIIDGSFVEAMKDQAQASADAAAVSEANAASSASTASTQASNAAASASNAAVSESNAAVSEVNASTSEANAAASETNALSSENKARQWAEELENVEVEPGQYSALHHASKAANSATAASVSAASAASSETNAAVSESNASTSEANAAVSESNAALSESSAATHASNAASSASVAATSETNAVAAASSAATSEAKALASENKSAAWAENPENIEVEPGKYSALHHKEKALDAQIAAETAQSAAETAQSGAVSAQGLAEDARDAAQLAKAGAETAQSRAVAAQGLAEDARDAAQLAQTGAETAEANALVSESKAQAWAENPENVEVVPGSYSAYHWAKQSELAARVSIEDQIVDGEVYKAPSQNAVYDALATKASISVYDANGDGKVNAADSADTAPWTGITGKPATYSPSSHGNEAHNSAFITSANVTFETLNANGDVGAGVTQVAKGDHNHDTQYLGITAKAADSDKLDGYHAGNASGNVPVSNGTVNTNLNADMVDGYHAASLVKTADYEDADVLAKIKNVDGTGSGLDADLLDGKHATSFVLTTDYENADVLAKVKAVDGAGSGLDADLLDGKHLSEIGGGMKYQIFTSSGTFTVPAGVTQVLVTLIGGGGGGSKGRGGSLSGAGGGGGGVYYRAPVTVTPGSSIPVTIGSGGAGGTSSHIDGYAGGTSSFGSYLSATGGGGGRGQGGSSTGGSTGSPSTTYYTQPGGKGMGVGWIDHIGGHGGGTVLGGPAPGVYNSSSRGLVFGGGGSGGGFTAAGGNGAPGVCIVEWEE